MQRIVIYIFCLLLVTITNQLKAQSIQQADTTVKTSTVVKKKHNPQLAAKRSAMIPGWGQIYNREYWKLPIVYGAISIPTVTFFYNNKLYKETKAAYTARVAALPISQGGLLDSTGYKQLQPLYQNVQISTIQSARNQYRRDRDYSILWFLVAWGLNVVDASVFGHLKNFDVSENLSMRVEPQYNPSLNSGGLQFVFSLRNNNKHKFSIGF